MILAAMTIAVLGAIKEMFCEREMKTKVTDYSLFPDHWSHRKGT
jgi:hypothetical protein